MTRKLKILLYGDVDINIMDGSAVWLTSMANVLNKDENISVDVLLKARIKNRNLLSEMDNLQQVNIIDTFTDYNRKFANGNRINTQEAVQLMEELDQRNDYHCVIVRGFQIVMNLLESPLSRKTIPYITDINHDKDSVQEDEKATLKKIYDLFPNMFVQTPETKELLKEVIGVDGKKLALLTPMIPDFDQTPDFTNKNNSMVYTGKFAKGWYTEEIISAFKVLNGKDRSLILNVAGDKFQGELIPEKEKITNLLKTQEGINWVGAIPRSKSLKFIDQSDIGIGWRSESIDNDSSLELSTKLLEYGRFGKPVLLRRTKMYEKLLGADYFLFVESEEDFVEKTMEIMYNRSLYRKTAKKVYEASKYYTFSSAYQRLRPVLWNFYNEKIKLVFAGHDLKFINMAIEYFKPHPGFEVKIDKWQGHNNHDEIKSKECLNWADVIFCEWGLGNAVWYSQNKKQGQKLIVRMHGQERLTDYPNQFKMENINKVIAVSPFIFEKFHHLFQIPREKMTMIYNLVDTNKFNKPKVNSQIQYNLGICGVLPSLKRLDRAINIFERLWETDNRYKLFVKSKMPKDLPWLMNRESEKQYYEDLFERINKAPWKKNLVFDQHGSNMEEWFRKIGYILSTSDFESFHLAPMEGMSSGSVPLVLHWTGAETIYPREFLFENEEQVVKAILQRKGKMGLSESMKKYPYENFDKKIIIKKLENCILA
ncbi:MULTISPECIES: glycosyltransferase [Peribacillus]|uniref:Glycosyl transferase, group 1 family n=1 Tax=Peribacillus simplex TaxID=1478 RepID=A0AAN2PKD0_9BACI|nr:glycosyltransferase [Peribacillus simplex]CEG33811.1 glycosyl transferase, group 1 family [Peribacillus simplex]